MYCKLIRGDFKDICLLLKDMFFYVQNDKDKFIKQTPRGFSVDINYTLKFEKFKPIFNISKYWPSSIKEKRLRFMINNNIWDPHKDKVLNRLVNRAIIFPIINCDNLTTTTWYNLKKGKLIEKSNAFFLDSSFNYELEILHEECLLQNTPVSIDVNTLHGVKNNSKKPRVVVGWYYDG